MTQDQRVTAQAVPVGRGCDSAGNTNGEPTPGCAGPSAGGTAPIPGGVSLKGKPFIFDSFADSACFAKPSRAIVTADIAAGGAARQDDSEPKGQSSACRPLDSAIPTSTTPTCPRCGDAIVRELPNSLLCDPCYRAALSQVTKADILAADAAYFQAIADEQNARKGQ